MKYQAGNIDATVPSVDDGRVIERGPSNKLSLNTSIAASDPGRLGRTMCDWLCLFTQPHREKLASGKLSELGFEVYLPFRRKLVLRQGKRVPMKLPLFPRYLFIRADKQNSHLFSAHRQMGVAGLAGRSFSQSLLAGSIIEAIKARECPDGYVGVQSNAIRPGQKVKILDGPFAAVDAIFNGSKGENRSILLLSLLGKTHRVVVSNENMQLVA